MTNLMNLNTYMDTLVRVGRIFPFHFPLTFISILGLQAFLKFSYSFKQAPKYKYLK